MLFKAPGDASYQSLTASQVDDSSTQYQGFVNVTAIVAAAGAGTYTTANVQLGTGQSDSGSGGWALVVAYGDPAAPSRNLSVFDGLQNVGSSSTVTIPLSGFQTPLTGPVTSTVGLVAYEGDLGTTGDSAAIQGGSGAFTALSNAVNPGPPATSASNSNVFNSTISNAGVLVTSRTPSFRNNLGYDADLFTTTNVLGNGQTSTQVRLSTSGDAYQPGVVTLATDLYAPRITATKTVDSATANLGDTLTYTVDVQNTGQDGATGTTFSDQLPDGTAFVPGSITVNGAPVSDAAGDDLGEFAGGSVAVRLGTGATAGAGGTLAPGASATVSFQVTVATAGLAPGATIDNTADLAFSAATTGVASTVTTAPATTSVNVPDLAIGKTHSPDLSPGQPTTYTITVGNVGAGPTAGTVTVTDTIEAGLTLTGPATGTGWMCTTLVTTITCTRPDALAAGSDYPPISIPVLVGTGTPPGQLSNTATLQAASDGNPDNNSFTDAGAVSEPAIDLHVEKVVTSTPDITPAGYATGETVTYRIQVSNNGIADAANVQLAETFDAALTIQSITPSQGSCTGTTCNLGTITNTQAPVTIDVEATLPPDLVSGAYPSGALLDNTATVSAPIGTETNPDDNSASATISTLPFADISLVKTFSPEQPAAGGPVTYTLTVHSDGPGTVDVTAADLLPAALLKPPTAISISGGTGVCRFDPTGESLGAPPGSDFPIIACDIPQFGPGEDRVITYTATLAPDSAGTEVTNFAISGAVVPFTDLLWDPDNFEDNGDQVTFTPGTVDVGVEKSIVGPNVVLPGEEATFRIRAFNAGTLPAPDVVVSDPLPTGFTPSDAPDGCTLDSQVLTCAIGTLPEGEERIFEVTGVVEDAAAGQVLRNVAAVDTSGPDLTPGNDTSEALLFVPPQPDLGVEKTRVGPESVPVGGEAVFALRVSNTGDAPGQDVVVRDPLPDGLTPISAPAGCAVESRVVVCTIGELPQGEQRTFEIRARVEGSAAGSTLTNRATVSAANPDPNPGNDQSQAQVTVPVPPPPPPPNADVALDVRAPSGPYTVGEPGTWELEVVNSGPTTASAVNLSARRSGARADTLGAQAAQLGCQTGGAAISCSLGDLAAGERRTIEVRLRPREAERLTLSGEVTTSTNDTVAENNTDEDSIRPRLATVDVDVDTGERRLGPGEPTNVITEIRTNGRPATDVSVCVRLPDALTIAKRGGARLRNGQACWQIERVAANRSRRFRLRVRALGVGRARRVTITAVVRGSGIRTRRARATVVVLPAQAPPVTG